MGPQERERQFEQQNGVHLAQLKQFLRIKLSSPATESEKQQLEFLQGMLELYTSLKSDYWKIHATHERGAETIQKLQSQSVIRPEQVGSSSTIQKPEQHAQQVIRELDMKDDQIAKLQTKVADLEERLAKQSSSSSSSPSAAPPAVAQATATTVTAAQRTTVQDFFRARDADSKRRIVGHNIRAGKRCRGVAHDNSDSSGDTGNTQQEAWLRQLLAQQQQLLQVAVQPLSRGSLSLGSPSTNDDPLTNGGTTTHGEHLPREEKEKIRHFILVLLMYLEGQHKALYEQAITTIKHCQNKSRVGVKGYESGTLAMRRDLKALVGEFCWKQVEIYVERDAERKEKGRTP